MSAHPPSRPPRPRAGAGLRAAAHPAAGRAGPVLDGSAAADLFGRQLEVLQAASARMSRADGREAVGRAVVEETGRIIDYHNARVYVLEPPDQLVPIAFEGRVGAYEQVDIDLLRTHARRGLHRLGRPARRAAPGPRRERRPARAPRSRAPTTSTSRCSSSRCATTTSSIGVITLSKLGLDQFDRRRPAAADDPRRPGRDRPRVGPATSPGARRSPASCAACST